MQINLFNGGLNKKLQPHLIGVNEAVICENVDLSTGVLQPIKTPKDLQTKVKSNIYKFNNHFISSDEDRDYVEFQNKLYYSNGLSNLQWSSDGFDWFNVGVEAPTAPPKISSINIADSLDIFNVVKLQFDAGRLEVSNPQTGQPFPKVEENYIAAIEVKSTVNNQNITSYVKYEFPSKNRTGSVMLCALEAYIKEPNIQGFYKYGVKAYVDGFTVFDYGLYPATKTNTVLNLDKVNIQETGDISKKLVIFKRRANEDFSIVESKTLEYTLMNTPKHSEILNTYLVDLEVVKYVELTTTEDFEELLVFADGIEVKALKDSTNPKKWYIDLSYRGRTIEDFANNTFIESVEYVYTYVSKNGNESMPSESSKFPIKFKPLYINVNKSPDIQVESINIYRRGQGLTQYSLVASVPNQDGNFIDELELSKIDGAVLNSFNNNPAPKGLKYLTISNVMMFGALNSTLYFTEVANPYVWSSLNFIEFDSEITGIGESANGLLIFTKYKTYIVTGNSPLTLSKFLLSASIGCILHKSIQILSNTLIWLSYEGICMSNGGSISVITRDKFSNFSLPDPKCSAILDDIYYLAYSGGVFVVNCQASLIFSYITDIFLDFCVFEDKLYAVDLHNNLVEVFNGDTNNTLHYKSPDYPDGSLSNIKIYKNIYVYSVGELELTIRVDDKIVLIEKLMDGFTELKVPASTKGYYISFEVKGSGTLKEIEYKFEGRQNGR